MSRPDLTDFEGRDADGVPLSDALAELKRELGQRRRLYPRWIAQGTLEKAEAQRRLERLKRALRAVEEQLAAERLL
jgi:hypothetical protein